MHWFLRMLGAWALSMVAYPILAVLVMRSTGSQDSGFREAMLGIGVLTAIPAFAFALVVGVPTMSFLAGLRPRWLLAPVASISFTLLMGLAALVFPEGWRGAAYALICYGAVLGLIWGGIDLLRAHAA